MVCYQTKNQRYGKDHDEPDEGCVKANEEPPGESCFEFRTRRGD